jgi:hypothetical protein
MHISKPIIVIAILLTTSLNGAGQLPGLNFPAQAAVLGSHGLDRMQLPENTIEHLLENCEYKGLETGRYHVATLRELAERPGADSARNILLADGLITYCSDLQRPQDIDRYLSYNGISRIDRHPDADVIAEKLSKLTSDKGLTDLISELEPADGFYTSLINELRIQIDSSNTKKVNALKLSIAYYRWIHNLATEKHILVNIPSTTLKYCDRGNVLLEIKVVVGKTSTKTPRFAAYCDQVILYPYWHVPRSIAVNEILPACKKNAGVPNVMNLQVLNSKGQVVDPLKLNWRAYSRNNFPYTFRQTTGCGNALGVIKFNIIDPFNVYMHDTNNKNAFNAQRRFMSHGCIRVENPIDLANYLLPTNIDEAFVKACVKGQAPVVKPFTPVPVFVVYMPATPDTNGKIIYHDDVYKIL